jgi:isopentenyldiphosphate isomerase
LRTSFVGQLQRSHILVGDVWHEGVRQFEAAGERGRTAYIAGLEVDTGEHPDAHDFRVVIAESKYSQCLAAKTLVSADSDAQGRVLDAVRQGSHHFVTVAPPTMVSVCVAVLSAENRMLTLRRSLAVRTYPGQWTVGINESMKYSDEPGREEDFFALVRRGLQEELGLGANDYGKIAISWLGWSGDAACYVLVATVRARLRSTQIDELRAQCHSVDEHDLAVWLPMTRSHIARITVPGGRGPDAAHLWSYLAPLVATELWRSRHIV